MGKSYTRGDCEVIVVPKSIIPNGATLCECYETKTQFIIVGDPEPDDETHNCDVMGCGSLSHVLYRFNKSPSPERSR